MRKNQKVESKQTKRETVLSYGISIVTVLAPKMNTSKQNLLIGIVGPKWQFANEVSSRVRLWRPQKELPTAANSCGTKFRCLSKSQLQPLSSIVLYCGLSGLLFREIRCKPIWCEAILCNSLRCGALSRFVKRFRKTRNVYRFVILTRVRSSKQIPAWAMSAGQASSFLSSSNPESSGSNSAFAGQSILQAIKLRIYMKFVTTRRIQRRASKRQCIAMLEQSQASVFNFRNRSFAIVYLVSRAIRHILWLAFNISVDSSPSFWFYSSRWLATSRGVIKQASLRLFMFQSANYFQITGNFISLLLLCLDCANFSGLARFSMLNSNCFICWFCSSFLIEASSPFSAVANGDVVKSVAASNTSLTAHENHQPRIVCIPLWSSFSCSLACATNFRELSSIMWLMKDFPLSWTTSDSDSMQIDTNHSILRLFDCATII